MLFIMQKNYAFDEYNTKTVEMKIYKEVKTDKRREDERSGQKSNIKNKSEHVKKSDTKPTKKKK